MSRRPHTTLAAVRWGAYRVSVLLLASLLAFSASPRPVFASGRGSTQQACKEPPLAAKGALLARVSRVRADGGTLVSLAVGAPMRAGVRGAAAWLSDCVGATLGMPGRVEDADSQAISVRFTHSVHVAPGAYVFVVPLDGPPLAALVDAPIISRRARGGNLEFVIGMGEEQGVFAGAEARLVGSFGIRALVVNASSRSSATLQLRELNEPVTDMRIFLRPVTPRCFPPPLLTPVIPSLRN